MKTPAAFYLRPKTAHCLCSPNVSFPDFDELDEDLIRIFSNYNRHMTQPQHQPGPAASRMTEAFPPAIVAPIRLQPTLQSFQGLASGDRRAGIGNAWGNPAIGDSRSLYPSPPVQTPSEADLFSQAATSNVQSQSTVSHCFS